MIKNLMKKSLILSTLILLVTFTVTSIRYGSWTDTYFVWEITLTSVLVCLVQLLLDRFKSNYHIAEILLEYAVICAIAGTMGLLFGWFQPQNLWWVLIYVTPVYIIGYFLDLSRTKRDIDYINEKIKQRAERGKKNERCNDNGQERL